GRGSEFAVYLPILDQRTGLTAGSGAAQRDGDAEAANAGRVLVDDDNTDARAKAAGFDHYLVKPVDADALARALRA
ncbi:MAG TPA: hypothetical protein VJ011_08390, partial [Steroidobacteraceae bacterium]|nr:hypothetical protein [Steroidobacteraceae bacterium]